ncbi:MAG TPA: ComF family protein [Candidatus Acidoferrales bacterium]|nr:ComF family protein [Candidatus Acidoferrales bacterium]
MGERWPASWALAARRVLREAAGGMVALAFPDDCRVCARPLEGPSRIPVCAACLDSFRVIAEPLCGRCGRPMIAGAHFGAAGPVCRLCRNGVYSFDCARSYASYDEALLRTITLLKHEAMRPLAAWFGGRLAEMVRGHPGIGAPDVVVPVPLHPDRLHERGFNQAELLARAVARRLGVPVEARAIERQKPRPAKRRLSRHQRWEAARGAYAAVTGTKFDNRRVLLVDDVFTTGATLDACTKALRTAGAAHVAALTVARVVDAASGAGFGTAPKRH